MYDISPPGERTQIMPQVHHTHTIVDLVYGVALVLHARGDRPPRGTWRIFRPAECPTFLDPGYPH